MVVKLVRVKSIVMSMIILVMVLASIFVTPVIAMAQPTGFVLGGRTYTPIFSVTTSYYAMFTSDSRLLFIAPLFPPGWLRYNPSTGEGYVVGGGGGAYIIDLKYMKLYHIPEGTVAKIKVTDKGVEITSLGSVPARGSGAVRYYITRDGYLYIHFADRLEIRYLNGTLIGAIPYRYDTINITTAYGFAVSDDGSIVAIGDGRNNNGMIIFRIYDKESVDYKIILYDGYVGSTRRMTISRDGRVLLVGSYNVNTGVHLYFISGDTVEKKYHDILRIPSGVGALQSDYDLGVGRTAYLFVGGFEGEMRIYQLQINPDLTYKLILLFNYTDPTIGRVYNPFGIQSGFCVDYMRRYVGFVGVNLSGYIVDLQTYEYIKLKTGEVKPTKGWAVSPDGRYVFFGSILYAVTLDDAEQGVPRMRITGHIEIPNMTLAPKSTVLPKIELKDKKAEWLWVSPAITIEKLVIEKGKVNLVVYPYYLAREKDLYQGYANIYTIVEYIRGGIAGKSETTSKYYAGEREISFQISAKNTFYPSTSPITLYSGSISFLRAKMIDMRVSEFLHYLNAEEIKVSFGTRLSMRMVVPQPSTSASPSPRVALPVIIAIGVAIGIACAFALKLLGIIPEIEEIEFIPLNAIGFEIIYNDTRYCALQLYLPTDVSEEDVEKIKEGVLDYLESGIRFKGVTLTTKRVQVSSSEWIRRGYIVGDIRNVDIADAISMLIATYGIPADKAYVTAFDVFPGIIVKVKAPADLFRLETVFTSYIAGAISVTSISVNKLIKNVVLTDPSKIYKYIRDVEFVFKYKTISGVEDIVVSRPEMVHDKVVIPINVPPGTVEVELEDIKVPSDFKFKIIGTVRANYVFKKPLTVTESYAYGTLSFNTTKHTFYPRIDTIEFQDLPKKAIMIFAEKNVVNNLRKALGENTTIIYVNKDVLDMYREWLEQWRRMYGANFTLEKLGETFSEAYYVEDNKTYWSYISTPEVVDFIDDVDKRILSKGDTLYFTIYFSTENDVWISVAFELKSLENRTITTGNNTSTTIISRPPSIPYVLEVTVEHNAPITNDVRVNVTITVNATIQFDPVIIVPTPTPTPTPPTPVRNNTSQISIKVAELKDTLTTLLPAAPVNGTTNTTMTIRLEELNGRVFSWIATNATKMVRELYKNKTGEEPPQNISFNVSLTYIAVARIVSASVNSVKQNDFAEAKHHVPCNVAIKWIPPPPVRYNVTVYVYTYVVNGTNITMEPVVGALVRLRFMNGTLVDAKTTDVDGFAVFKNVSNGTYVIEVEATGYKPAKKTVTVDRNIYVMIGLEPETLPVGTAWLKVYTVAVDNRELPGVWVRICKLVNNTWECWYEQSSGIGTLDVLLVANETYMVEGFYVNNTRPIKYIFSDDVYNVSSEPIVFYAEANKTYKITMVFNISQRLKPSIGTTTFRVYVYDGRDFNKPLANVSVSAVFRNRNGTVVDVVNGTTNASGIFEFNYTVRNGSVYMFWKAEFYASLEGWRQLQPPYVVWVTDVNEGKITFVPIAMAPLEVLQANNTTNVTVIVLQRTGVPLQNASVELYVNGNIYSTGITGSDGSVTFVVPVNVTVYARACYNGVCNTSTNYTTTLKPLTIVLTLDIEVVEENVTANYVLLVHTIDAITAEDLPGVLVTLYYLQISNESLVAWSVTNDTGYAEFLVPPGYYVVYGNKSGYKSIVVDIIVNRDNVTLILPMVPEEGEFITPPPESNETAPPVVINNTTYWWLHISVIYEDYVPVEGANISVTYSWNNTSVAKTLRTGSDGEAWLLVPDGALDVNVTVQYLAFTETRMIPVMNMSYWLVFMVNYTSEYYAPEVGILYACITTVTHISDFEQLFEALIWTNVPQTITLSYEVYKVVNDTVQELLWNTTKTLTLPDVGWWNDRVWFTLNISENTTIVGIVRITSYENDTDESNNIYVTQPVWYRPYIDVYVIAFWKVVSFGNKELAVVPELTTIALTYQISLSKNVNMTIPVKLYMEYKDLKVAKKVTKTEEENITLVNATANRTLALRVPWTTKIDGYVAVNIMDDNTLNNNASISYDIPPNIKILEVSAPPLVGEGENFTVKVKIIANTNDTVTVTLNSGNGTLGTSSISIQPGISILELKAKAPTIPPIFFIFKKPSETYELGVAVSNYDVYVADNTRLIKVEVVTNMGWILLILVALALITTIAITVKVMKQKVFAIKRKYRYVVEE